MVWELHSAVPEVWYYFFFFLIEVMAKNVAHLILGPSILVNGFPWVVIFCPAVRFKHTGNLPFSYLPEV